MWVLIVQRIISIVLCLSSLENKINLIFNVLFFLVKLASKRGEGGSCTLTPVSLVVGIHFVISQLHILYYSTKALIPRFIFQAKWREEVYVFSREIFRIASKIKNVFISKAKPIRMQKNVKSVALSFIFISLEVF